MSHTPTTATPIAVKSDGETPPASQLPQPREPGSTFADSPETFTGIGGAVRGSIGAIAAFAHDGHASWTFCVSAFAFACALVQRSSGVSAQMRSAARLIEPSA